MLWIDGVEISTTDGHYATVGMSRAPFPLGGDARDVVDDVTRLGGIGVIAHGDSVKSEGQWRDWSAKTDGLEWLNLDSAWREAGGARLVRAGLTYWLRPAETLAALLSRPDGILARLDTAAEERHVITIAATDAHGRMVPSYDACFQAFSTRVELDRPLSGDAGNGTRVAIIDALRAGHHYTAIDALASPAVFEFLARSADDTFTEGDTVPDGRPVTFDVRVAGLAGLTPLLLRNGVPVNRNTWSTDGADFRGASSRTDARPNIASKFGAAPGAPGTPPVPWIVSNPVYVGLPPTAQPSSTPVPPVPPTSNRLVLAWHGEGDPSSTVHVDAPTPERGNIGLRYTLGSGPAASQFAAAAASAPATLLALPCVG